MLFITRFRVALLFAALLFLCAASSAPTSAHGAALVVPDRSTELKDMPTTVCTNQYLKGGGGVYICADAAGGGGPETDPVYVAATTPIEVNTTPYAPLPANVNKLHKLNIQTTINLPMTGFVAGDRLSFLSMGAEGFVHTFVSEGEGWQAYIKVGSGDTLSFVTEGAPGESYVFQFTDQWVLIDAFDLKYAYQSDKITQDQRAAIHGANNPTFLNPFATMSNLHTQNTDQALDAGGLNEVTAATLKTLADNNSGTNTGDQDLSGYALLTDARFTDARTPTSHSNTAHSETYLTTTGSAANLTSFPTLNQNTSGTAAKATNMVGGNGTTLLGAMPYQSNTDTTTLLSPNTAASIKYLSMTGTGTDGAAPVWSTISGGGTVTSVTAGDGMTQTGTATIDPTFNIVSHAGTAGSIGTINVGADAIGVNLGSTSTTAAAGNDSRLSDARTPTAHNQDATTITTGVLAPDRLATGSGLQVLRRNTGNTALEFATLAGGGDLVSTNNLSDVASAPTALSNLVGSYTGNSLKVVRVNTGETDLEYAAISAGSAIPKKAGNARGPAVGTATAYSREDHVHASTFFTDFINYGTTPRTLQGGIWLGAAIASGSTQGTSGLAQHPGIVGVNSSTSANSGWQWTTGLVDFLLAGSEESEFVFYTSNNTDATYRMGFLDSITSTEPIDGCWLSIINVTARGYCKNAAGPTSTASTYTITTTTWYRGYIEVNSNATSVQFTLYAENGTQLWTDSVSANIPNTAGRETGHGSVWTNGGAATLLLGHIDYMSLTINRSPIAR